MSFSSEVKQELAKQSGKSRHCQIAELAALVAFDGKRQQLIGDAGDVLDSKIRFCRKNMDCYWHSCSMLI